MATTRMATIDVPLGARSYQVRIGAFEAGAAAEALAFALGRPTGVAVLCDGQVAAASPRVRALLAALGERLPDVPLRHLDLPPGEACKTMAAVERTCQWMAESGFDRGAVVIGVGGGAATDHAGFAAAIYLRGIPFALCPTTLLAMVDASIGGKTGVDLPAGKNLVGAFHQPRLVLADLGFLTTLPGRELTSGMAEVVKAGLIGDAALFERLERQPRPDGDALAEIIAAAVHVKVAVVTGDEREGGRRAILNFGHTLGHALESESAYALLHGEAVSLGMMAALALGEARGVTRPALRPRVGELLGRVGLPVDLDGRITPAVLGRMEVDKKRRADRVQFIFVPRLGEAVAEDIPLAELKRQVTAAIGAA
jgi:3-dehydroquinate synthase